MTSGRRQAKGTMHTLNPTVHYLARMAYFYRSRLDMLLSKIAENDSNLGSDEELIYGIEEFIKILQKKKK